MFTSKRGGNYTLPDTTDVIELDVSPVYLERIGIYRYGEILGEDVPELDLLALLDAIPDTDQDKDTDG